MIRRTFLAAFAFLPVASSAVPSAPSITTAQRQRLTDLIEELESAPTYQMAAVVWASAHIAGQMREALGIEVPACQDRQRYLEFNDSQRKAEDARVKNFPATRN